jgi:hypothetical protein
MAAWFTGQVLSEGAHVLRLAQVHAQLRRRFLRAGGSLRPAASTAAASTAAAACACASASASATTPSATAAAAFASAARRRAVIRLGLRRRGLLSSPLGRGLLARFFRRPRLPQRERKGLRRRLVRLGLGTPLGVRIL